LNKKTVVGIKRGYLGHFCQGKLGDRHRLVLELFSETEKLHSLTPIGRCVSSFCKYELCGKCLMTRRSDLKFLLEAINRDLDYEI
jgi:hypothetical protein